MAQQHDSILDPNIHEPKGASTADAGDVYIADGAGSGAWKKTILANHGQMTITNNSTATATTAATDATLNTDSDYVKVTVGWSDPHTHGVSFSVDKLIVAVSGHYELAFWSSIKVPTINNFVGIKYSVNDGTPYSLQKMVSQSVTGNDYKSMSGHGGADLIAGDTVSIYIASTKTENLVIEEAGLSLHLLHES